MNLQADIVTEFDGDIDKYVGDELMAVFEGKDMIMRAVKCAEKIVRTIQKAYSESGEVVQVGIGINTGELIAGNMGSGDRMDRTVIGDTVNLGARLCSIAGKNVVVISEFSYESIKNKVRVKKHKPIKVKGKSKSVGIYTLRKTL
jgi:adenylate cyclase